MYLPVLVRATHRNASGWSRVQSRAREAAAVSACRRSLHVEHLGASWCFTNRGQPPRVRSAPPGWTEAARSSPRTRRAAAPPPCHHHSERQTCAHRVETVGRGGGGWLAHVEKEMFEWVGMHGVDEPIFTIWRSKRLKRDTMDNRTYIPHLNTASLGSWGEL